MIEIPLSAIPNQKLSIQLDNQFYDITIKEANKIMVVTVVRNGTTIIDSVRVVAGTPILPYEYLELGNFIFLTSNEEYPYYTKFGVDQSLIFASQAELEVIRGT